jgi:hypothetical protein
MTDQRRRRDDRTLYKRVWPVELTSSETAVQFGVAMTVRIVSTDEHPVSTVTSHVGRRHGLVVKHKVRDCPRHRVYQSGVRMGRQIVLQLGLEGSAQRRARLHALAAGVYRPPRLTTGSMDIGPMLGSTYSDSRSCSSKSLTSFWRRSVVTGSFPKAAARLACSSLRSSSFGRSFNHGDTLLSIIRGSGAMVHNISASFLLEAERANLSVKLPKLIVAIDN